MTAHTLQDAAAPTRYAGLTQPRAAAILAAWLACVGWLLIGAGPRAEADVPRAGAAPEGGDAALYAAVVARVRAGQGYYDAAEAELRRRNYPVRPVFNWRQPTYAWLLAHLPDPRAGTAMLAVVGLAVTALANRWTRRSALRRRAPVVTGLVALTMAGFLAPPFVFMQEAWAGSLVALSTVLFAVEAWPLAVAAGLGALAFRELALLPCAVALALAVRRKRWPEVAAWLAGLAAYALLMSCHFAHVARHVGPADAPRSWIAFGGPSFVLATAQWSGVFVLLPRWALAVVLPSALLALAGWRDAAAARVALIVAGYVAAFSVVGNPFNDYWGAVYAPLCTFGLIAVPDCARDLRRALVNGPPAR